MPVKNGGRLSVNDRDPGPWRVYPPQGAHASRRVAPPMMGMMGQFLQRFDPITAEHLMWAAPLDRPDFEHPSGPNPGTSCTICRVTAARTRILKVASIPATVSSCPAVDTADEVSVHLQQIDSGPNYRWGIAGQNGSGVIYYYAAGKCYSHNGTEDVGDRECDDTDFACNFGVFKDGRFKSIGQNVLDSPLYDLGTAQLAELLPARGSDAYSWPQYQSRRVMLVGADYMVVYDAVYNDAISTRFAWFTEREEQLPSFAVLKGSNGAVRRTDLTTAETKGVWFDSSGDSEMLVTHLPGIVALRDGEKILPWLKADSGRTRSSSTHR